MTVLLTAHSLAKAFGTVNLFQGISLAIHSKDKLGLIGPNGSGKSTLLKILSGQEMPDSGFITKKQDLKIGYASQSPEIPEMEIGEFLLLQVPSLDSIEAKTRASTLLSKAEFADEHAMGNILSGGWKKRLDIIRALMSEPDLLLLDEPTNHLDLEGILWLESFLKKIATPFVVISHDRYFLDNVTNRMVELNKCYPDGLLECKGTMSDLIVKKNDFFQAAERKERELSFKVSQEVNWLRTSPKARTTKSVSRIQQAYELIDELQDVKMRRKKEVASIDFQASDRETRKLLVAKNIAKSFEGKPLFKGIDLALHPGSRIGIVGKNGTGKTTLLKVLAGMIPQDMGTIKCAEDLKIVYFDQHRETLSPDLTLKEALCPSGDTVDYRGQKIHVNGWARRFLFPSDKLKLPIGYLSGGERARVLIARLMLKSADVLFLDEPTNDLDIETLEVIEESLLSFNGAVVLISHDRCLMDSICSNLLVLGENLEHQFFADYSQYLQAASEKEKPKERVEKPQVQTQVKASVKLSFHEKKELEEMESRIVESESEVQRIQDLLQTCPADPDLYRQLAEAQKGVEHLYQRWDELEKKKNSQKN